MLVLLALSHLMDLSRALPAVPIVRSARSLQITVPNATKTALLSCLLSTVASVYRLANQVTIPLTQLQANTPKCVKNAYTPALPAPQPLLVSVVRILRSTSTNSSVWYHAQYSFQWRILHRWSAIPAHRIVGPV